MTTQSKVIRTLMLNNKGKQNLKGNKTIIRDWEPYLIRKDVKTEERYN